MFGRIRLLISLCLAMTLTAVAQDKRTEEDKDDTFEET